MLHTPPCTSLASTAAVCEFEGSPAGVWFSGQDVADCFYQFRIPSALQRFFGLRPVRATDLGQTHVGGHRLPLNALVLPCLVVLPMGFSWAHHWTQEAHRFLIDQAGPGGDEHELIDRKPPPVLTPGKPVKLVYVDKELFMSTSPQLAESERLCALAHLEAAGLPMREIEDHKRFIETIGLELDGVLQIARLRSEKRWKLRAGPQGCLAARLVPGKRIEIIIGHITHAMLLFRPSLAVFRSCYDFVRRRYHLPIRLWPSARRDIRICLGLLPLLRAEWRQPWAPVAHCADATLNGFAVHEAFTAKENVRHIGRWSERWGFHWGAGDNPRERALAPPAPDEAPTDENVPLTLTPSFPEAPKSFVDGLEWKLIQARPYRYKEPAHMKEARATLFGPRRRARQDMYHGTRQLYLCDNLGVTLAFEKGRAANVKMSSLCRKWGALCLTANIRSRVRWIASELNPSDEDSRRFEPKSRGALATPMDSQPPLLHRFLPRVRCVKSGLASRATMNVTQAKPNCRILVGVGAGSAAASSLTHRTGDGTSTVLRILTRANSPLLVAPLTPACPAHCSAAALPLPSSLVGSESRQQTHMNLVHKVLTETPSWTDGFGTAGGEAADTGGLPAETRCVRRLLHSKRPGHRHERQSRPSTSGVLRQSVHERRRTRRRYQGVGRSGSSVPGVRITYRSGRTGLLPRARRALQGWHRVAPLPTRLPIPWPGLSACACMLLGLGHRLAALAVLLAADAYLRPCELLSLRGGDVIPDTPHLGPAFSAITAVPGRKRRAVQDEGFQPFCDTGYAGAGVARTAPLASCASVRPGRAPVPVHSPSIRRALSAHASSGTQCMASHTIRIAFVTPARRTITWPDSARFRQSGAGGGWLADASVRRYEKSSRVTSRPRALQIPYVKFFRTCDFEIAEVLSGIKMPPPPWFTGSNSSAKIAKSKAQQHR